VGQILHGQLGYSRLFAREVGQIVLPALGHTALLAAASMLLALGIGLPLGIIAGALPGSRWDRTITSLSYLSLSMPTFWLGLMLIALFSVWLDWLPASGSTSLLSSHESGIADRLRHLILPAVTLAVGGAGQYIRHMRASMIAEAKAPYLRTARAKGCSPIRVVLNHHVNNALLPVITIAALEAGALMSGALVTETVFAWPGLGRLSYDAIMGNDYNLALSALLLATLLTVVTSALADFAYGIIDPRIRSK
jgi:peptide/nickel transport system permease protein